MNNKEIEEMAHGILMLNKKINTYCALHSCEECLNTFPYPDCEEYNFAQSAVILGYRKIPEGSVVLSKEEYEILTNQNKGLKEENHTLRLENNDLEAENEKLKNYNDKLSQGIYFGNGEQFCNRLEQARKETAKEIIEIIKEAECADLNYIAQKYRVEE